MKFVTSLLFFTIGPAVFSQGWIKVNQASFNVTYKLPSSWTIDGFGRGFGSWDEHGSSVCDCAGTINYGLNSSLGMVIYPFDKVADMMKRNFVWDYEFVSSTTVASIQTKVLEFKKEISSWKLKNGSDESMKMLDDEVWRFTFTGARYGLVIYFWGDKEIMQKNATTISKIMDSIRLVKL